MDNLTLLGLLLSGVGHKLEKGQARPQSPMLDTLLSAGLEGANLSGDVMTCVQRFTGPSGLTRCAKYAPSGVADVIIDPKKTKGGYYGADLTYRHPSVTEGEASELPARYRVVEMDLVITSHDQSKGFSPDRRYPDGIQDRDYANPKGQDQLAVIRNAQNLDPNLVLGCSTTASEGTPIIWKDEKGQLIVLSGNSRAMAIKRARSEAPERYQVYRDQLSQGSAQYGLMPSNIDGHKAPILVREIGRSFI